jgi:hypothetical protein
VTISLSKDKETMTDETDLKVDIDTDEKVQHLKFVPGEAVEEKTYVNVTTYVDTGKMEIDFTVRYPIEDELTLTERQEIAIQGIEVISQALRNIS